MEKAYPGMDWENRPSTASPLDEINLDAISRGLSTVDDRVIDLYNAQQLSVKQITVDETTGLITITKNDGNSYTYNPSTRIYATINANQQATQTAFSQVNTRFSNVHDLLDAMDLKIDINAETANQGLTNLQTTITQNDGYYRQEMSGISTNLNNVQTGLNDRIDATNEDISVFKSSITQTTQAIQLSVSSVSGTVSDLSDSLDSNVARLEASIAVTADSIAMKVSKLEVIDDLALEFESGIQIAPNRITIASTGSLVVNTIHFTLDEDGNATFDGHVDMASGSVAGKPLVTSNGDGDELAIDHVHNAWKLRSAKVSGSTRYYTYLTKNRIFIVSDEHDGGHTSSNDVTNHCSIGSKNYPWSKGYFNWLRIQETKNNQVVTHDVLPEGLPVTIPATGWVSESGVYTLTQSVQGITTDTYLYLATETKADLIEIFKNRIDVDTFTDGTVTFIAASVPSADVNAILLVEDFIRPHVEGADLLADFDEESKTLAASWDSPDEFSKFVDWQKDTFILQKWDETTETWVDEYSVESTTRSEYALSPLIIGGT